MATVGPADIVNMDQSMVRFDMPVKWTSSVKGAKAVRIKMTKSEKRGFTVALTATASGAKLPAVVISHKRDGILGVLVRRQLHIPNSVRVSAMRNSWMTSPEYHRWLCGTLDDRSKNAC